MRRIGYVMVAAWQGFWRNPVMSIAATLMTGLRQKPCQAETRT